MVTRKGYTTITISKPLKERLDALKAHPRQTYEELITKILDERAPPLSPEEAGSVGM
jgi:hypothetical protein